MVRLGYIWLAPFPIHVVIKHYSKIAMFLLILSTLLACSHIFIAPVIVIIMNIISKETSMEKQMKAEVVDLKKQLQTVNMVDQFPAYAKLQRKINAQTTRYKENE
ncbi:Tail-anchored protein insertion receptor WRB [Armadillidium nasatum]|uniref:Guided entry of tail-anchored proteins factor 1 n=1 Tax=Armadillidium nasatum TaxID=96803 RepID=A0A5N5T8U3_9CRUS|nr:Tail-anchored protein insertion receptor WRB [Armadillidium nasatum]